MSDTPAAPAGKDEASAAGNAPDLPTISPMGEVILLKGDIEEAEQQARDLNRKVTHALEEFGLPLSLTPPTE
jgi:hypothetical protein